MASYRFLVGDLLTGVLREEMPFTDIKYSQVLNAPGAFTASIGLRHPKATRANLDPGRTVIYVERDGVLLWGGILWVANPSVENSKIGLAGEGFWSYFRRRFIRTTHTYAATDQFAIAQDLLNYAQGISGGDIGVAVGAETSGVDRDRTYNSWERKNIGDAIEQLAGVEDGFDFAIDVAYDSGGTITKTFRPSYPQRGRSTAIVFELGTNLRGLSQQINGAAQANLIDVIGAGAGADMLIATVSDASVLATYPLLEDVVSYKDVTETGTLTAHGNAELAARATPVEAVPSISQGGADTGLGSYITGDEVTVRGHDGYVDVDDRMRITQFEVGVDDQGGETVSVSLQPATDFV